MPPLPDPMSFEELDETTRYFLLSDFEADGAGSRPYRSAQLALNGITVFLALLREAIRGGDEQTLIESLRAPSYWKTHNAAGRAINLRIASQVLGFLRGLSADVKAGYEV